MKSFFLKKELEMKKKGLVKVYESLIWNDVRNYISNSSENANDIKNENIVEYIVVTPFTITH